MSLDARFTYNIEIVFFGGFLALQCKKPFESVGWLSFTFLPTFAHSWCVWRFNELFFYFAYSICLLTIRTHTLRVQVPPVSGP